MGTSNDPRLSDQQVADLMIERNRLYVERDILSDKIREINCKLHASGEAKLWDGRKETITAASSLLGGASDADLESWLAKASSIGPVPSRAELREMFAEAQRGTGLYKAWVAAVWLLRISGTVKP